jgi:hypothetical protein
MMTVQVLVRLAVELKACPELGNAGEHRAGVIKANGEDVTEYCWWSTTYTIYRQDAASP